jgi:hypothetical protein
MRLSMPALLCSVLLFLCSSSWAQEAPEGDEEDWASYFILEEVLLRGSRNPNLDAARAQAQPTLILESSENGDTRVKARVGVEIGKRVVLDLKVESPRKSGETTLASLDGLTDSSTAELGFTWIYWKPKEYAHAMITKYEQAALQAPIAAKDLQLKSYGETSMFRPSAVEALGPELYRETVVAARDAIESKFPPIFLTASAKAGPNEFRFVDSVTLEPGKESHTSRELSAELGMYLAGRYYTSLSYSQGRAFSAGRAAQICAPFGTTRALECEKFTVGPPTQESTGTLALELRRLFKSIGFAARVQRDLEHNVTGIEVPIYFLQKLGTSEMELNGGIVVKWRSDTKDYVVSAFIGPALSTVFRMVTN